MRFVCNDEATPNGQASQTELPFFFKYNCSVHTLNITNHIHAQHCSTSSQCCPWRVSWACMAQARREGGHEDVDVDVEVEVGLCVEAGGEEGEGVERESE